MYQLQYSKWFFQKKNTASLFISSSFPSETTKFLQKQKRTTKAKLIPQKRAPTVNHPEPIKKKRFVDLCGNKFAFLNFWGFLIFLFLFPIFKCILWKKVSGKHSIESTHRKLSEKRWKRRIYFPMWIQLQLPKFFLWLWCGFYKLERSEISCWQDPLWLQSLFPNVESNRHYRSPKTLQETAQQKVDPWFR